MVKGGRNVRQNQQERLSQVQFIKAVIISIIFVLLSTTIIMAVETNTDEDPNCQDKYLTDDQYFELRAVSVKDVMVENQEVKQVMTELWGNNITFKRI